MAMPGNGDAGRLISVLVDQHLGDTELDNAKRTRRTRRNIDDPTAHEWAAIVDATLN